MSSVKSNVRVSPVANKVGSASRRHWWQKWYAAAVLASILGGAALAGIQVYFEEDFRANRLLKEQQVLQKLSIVRAQLESFLNSDLYQVKGLIGLPMTASEIDEQLFDHIASELAGSDHRIMSLQLAPKGVVTYVWPYAGNKGAIGHDLLADPNRRLAANKAIESRQLWVAGPVKLIQGGVAIIGRYPIFVRSSDSSGEQFWGFASILVDWLAVVERARQVATDMVDIEIGIRGKDGLGAQGDQIYGQPEVFNSTPITMDVVLPGGVWQLAAVPVQGWLTEDGYKVEQRLFFYAVALLLAAGFYTLLRLPVRLRRMVEEATDNLRQSENRLVDAIEAIPDAFAIFDATDRLVLCNDNFRSTYQRSQPAIRVGATASSLIQYGIEQGQYAASADQACGTQDAQLLSSKLEQHAKGESHYEEHLSDGRVLRVIQRRMRDGGLAGIRVDITDLKCKERELTEARFRADAANEAKNTFLATVSHELRTPLNVVIGVLTVLESSTHLAADEKERVLVANRSGKHLLALVNEILDLSRIESGALELESTAFRLSDLMKPVLSYADFSSEQKDLRFEYVIDEGIPAQCIGDSVRLRQILFNLLSNAVKFTEQGVIRLSVSATAQQDGRVALCFCVDDSGPGITEAAKSHLFKPFALGDASLSRAHGGAGMGLALSRRLARKMGGDIETAEAPLGGARFLVTVPLALASTEAVAEESPDAEPILTSYSKRRVLVVDDSPTNQLVVECLLEGTGYDLHYVDGGAQAIEVAQAQVFDIILMDISMPEMDGVEATRRIRGLLQDKCPAVVAVTAHSMAGDRERYLSQGLDGFITKPIEKQALIEAIETCQAANHGPGKLCLEGSE